MGLQIIVNGVDRSSAYQPGELSGINYQRLANMGEVGQGQIPIPRASSFSVYSGQPIQLISDGVTVLDGFVGSMSYERGEYATNRLVQTMTVTDDNAVLNGMRAMAWSRPVESTRARFLAFLSAFVPEVTSTTWVTTTKVHDMEAKSYTTDALFAELSQEISDLTGNVMFVENRRAHLHPRNEGIPAGLSISDVSADFVTVFPPYNPRKSSDPYDLGNDITVRTPTATANATDATSITRHDSGGIKHQRFIELQGGSATHEAAELLNAYKNERFTYECEIGPLTADQVDALPVGSLVHITSAVMGLTDSVERLASATFTYRYPDTWNAALEFSYPLRITTPLGKEKDTPFDRTPPPGDGGEDEPCCPPWSGVGTPESGQEVPFEYIATGDGTTSAWVTSFPYMPGSLKVRIDGIPIAGEVTEVTPTTGAFSISFVPEAGEVVRAGYFAA